MATATIPYKNNIKRDAGTVVLTISRNSPLNKKEQLLKIGEFDLTIEPTYLALSANEESVELPLRSFYEAESEGEYDSLMESGEALVGEMYRPETDGHKERRIIWSWIGDNHRLLVYDKNERTVREASFEGALSGEFGLIELAVEPYWSGSYQSVHILANDFLYESVAWYNIERFIREEDTLFHADYTTPTHYVKEPIIETTMAPKDQSPILVENSNGAMTRQYFFDHKTGFYSKTNTETFLYRNEDVFTLSYSDLEPNFLVTIAFESGETFQASHIEAAEKLPFYVKDNQVFLDLTQEQKDLFYGTHLDITYQLRDSYTVEYNEDVAHDSLKIHLINHKDDEVRVIQEGNRFTNQRLGRELELNPLVNSQNTGFIYIDTDEQVAESFRLNISSTYLTADGLDSASFIVEVIDAEGNEILSPEVDAYVVGESGRFRQNLGTITPVINADTLKARNTSGRCYFTYKTQTILSEDDPLTRKIFLVAVDRKSGIGAQVPLFVRPVKHAPTYQVKEETSVEAIFPFEVFARFYERPVDENHKASVLDFNGNGTIDREDFAYFNANKNNEAVMKSLANQIKKTPDERT